MTTKPLSIEERCEKLESALLMSIMINAALVVFVTGLYWGWWY